MSAPERIGDWMQTFRGRAFWPMDPRADEVHIDDIAHSLAMQCRYAGHTRWHYSVAQHSYYVSHLVPAEHALWGLLHDAAEAYLVDLPRPVKRSPGIGSHYVEAERRVMDAICDRFGLPREEPPEVKVADDRVLLAEKRDLMAPAPMPWRETGLRPMPVPIERLAPDQACAMFRDRFRELTAAKAGR